MIVEDNLVPISYASLGVHLPQPAAHPVGEAFNTWWHNFDPSSTLWQALLYIPGSVPTISAIKGGDPSQDGAPIEDHAPINRRYYWKEDQSTYGQSPLTALALCLDGTIHSAGFLSGNEFPERRVTHLSSRGSVTSDNNLGAIYHNTGPYFATWGDKVIDVFDESAIDGIATPVVVLSKGLLSPTWSPVYSGTKGFRFSVQNWHDMMLLGPSRYTTSGSRTRVTITGCSSIAYTGNDATVSYVCNRVTNNDSSTRVVIATHNVTVRFAWSVDTSFQQTPISNVRSPQYYTGTLTTTAVESYYRSYYGTTVRTNSGITSSKTATFDSMTNVFTSWPQADGHFVGGNLKRYWSSLAQGDRAVDFKVAVEADFHNIAPLGPLAALDSIEAHITEFEALNYETLAEAREVFSIASPYKALKRLSEDIALGRRGMYISALELASGIYLGTEFGIDPLIDTVEEVTRKREVLAGACSVLSQPAILRGFRSYNVPGGAYGYSDVRISVHSKVVLTATVGSVISSLLRASDVGLLPTLSQLWATGPWTFALDWFLNMTERLESVETAAFAPAMNVNGVVYGYLIEAYLTDEELEAWSLRQSLAPPIIRLYKREYSRLPPMVTPSRFDFQQPGSVPQILGGSLLVSAAVPILG